MQNLKTQKTNRFVQMNRAGENAGEFYANLRATDYHLGKVKLGDFAKVFAETYKKSV